MLKDVCFPCPQINVPKRNPMSTVPVIELRNFLSFMLKILNLLLYNTLKIFVTDTLFFISLLKNLHGSIMKYYENVCPGLLHSNPCTPHALH